MVEIRKSTFASSLAGVFLAGCLPNFTSKIGYKPYHDPFDTSRAIGFAQMATGQSKYLQQILDRSIPGGQPKDEATFSPDYLPFGTIALEGVKGNKEATCVCYRRRIKCGGADEFQIGKADLGSYDSLMERIDSEARARAGAPARKAETPAQPVVPVE